MISNREIEIWYTDLILGGVEKDIEIKNRIEASSIFLILVSSNSIFSDEINLKQINVALKRNRLGKIILIPILLKPCQWEILPIAKNQVLPTNKKPISLWRDLDEAFLEVIENLRRVVLRVNK